VPQEMPTLLDSSLVTVTTVYSLLVFDIAIKSLGLFMCARDTQILATASNWEWRLFRSAHPEVQRQFKSGD